MERQPLFYLVVGSKTSKGFKHLQSKTEVVLLEVTWSDCSVVGISIFCQIKCCLMTTSPKIVMSNKMANNVWEVNERCSVSIFHSLNYNLEADDKQQE